MSKSEFLDHVLELLSEHDGIKARAMFGGYGIYKYGQIFALIIKDELYFKVDDTNREYFVSVGSAPFEYEKNGKKYYMSYYKTPAEIYDDQELLNSLVEASYQISYHQKSSKK